MRRARLGGGFCSALAAAEHFGWKRWTYSAREQGARPIDEASVATYAKAFLVPFEYIAYGDHTLPSQRKGWQPGVCDREEARLSVIYGAPLEKIIPALGMLDEAEVSRRPGCGWHV